MILLLVSFLPGCGSDTSIQTGDQPLTRDFAAHWMQPGEFVARVHPEAAEWRLYHSDSAALDTNPFNVGDAPWLELVPSPGNPADRYLGFGEEFALLNASDVPGLDRVKAMLKSQLLLVQLDAQRVPVQVSQVQTARVIDAVYTAGTGDADEVTDYGATTGSGQVQFKLWAPTARQVTVLLFDQDKRPLDPASLDMQFDARTGAWTAIGGSELDRAFFQYQLTVYHPATQRLETLVTTDPYSLSLSTNSRYSQVVDLDDPDTMPEGWGRTPAPEVGHYEDSVLYEMHIRDFSAHENRLSDENHRGRYKAFSEQDSDGIRHLKSLRQAGLTHLHLLPTYDLGTINEDPEQVLYPDDPLSKLCRINPDMCMGEESSGLTLRQLLQRYGSRDVEAQSLIETVREYDPYNWGYDPFHYTVPEGSYAVNPDGISRLVEFREMVQAVHRLGFRLVMDVVYNHTFAAGLDDKSVLDKVVPNYYHRLNQVTGEIEQSTCCENTATENVMMGKLMLDSLEVWARDYRIDGFRFDLMGHQPRDLMLEAYQRVRATDPDNYFYGEGWNFGEVANSRLFVQATQSELGGTEIGTFSDRLRDAVRGGSYNAVGMGMRETQGIGNGLYTLPNDLQPDDRNRGRYLLHADQLRVGLAGNLAGYQLVNAAGETVTGAEVPYGGGGTGYALDPADTIHYVSKHDNQTLWDNHQYRIPYDTSTEDRVRMQTLSLAYPMLAQGIPFIHMGSELLRSKSFLRDSFNYGDWFNAVDFSMQTNNYDVGLPPAGKDRDNWPLIMQVLENNQGRDQIKPEHIRYTADIFREWLQIRSSSPLFRMTNGEDIKQRISFLNTGPDQVPGLIVMRISDSDSSSDLDPALDEITVLFNSSGDAITFEADRSGYQLHPVQIKGVDPRMRDIARLTPTGFTVPGLSAAVFVKPAF
ncbi:MAG: pullulanase-type alpha-1,6-glucosidase [Xanthomonadales bacterium]|nr:pullulanase-type alpha-1,6-glucosidase [Xanthomonadales bacterium]